MVLLLLSDLELTVIRRSCISHLNDVNQVLELFDPGCAEYVHLIHERDDLKKIIERLDKGR